MEHSENGRRRSADRWPLGENWALHFLRSQRFVNWCQYGRLHSRNESLRRTISSQRIQRTIKRWGIRHSPPGSRTRKQKTPGGIQVKPALRAEPTGRHAWNMQQRVATHAHHFRSVPVQKGSGRLSNLGRMRHTPDTDRAPLALIFKHPPHAGEKYRKGRD